MYWILPEALYDELVRSKKTSFPLIIPDEEAELAKVAQLQDALKEASKAAAVPGSAVAAAASMAAARANLDKKLLELIPLQAPSTMDGAEEAGAPPCCVYAVQRATKARAPSAFCYEYLVLGRRIPAMMISR